MHHLFPFFKCYSKFSLHGGGPSLNDVTASHSPFVNIKCLGEKPLSWLELIFSTSNSKSARKRAEHPFQPPKIMQSRGLRGIPSNSILAKQKAGIVDFRDEIHFAFKAANLKIKKSVRATHFFFPHEYFSFIEHFTSHQFEQMCAAFVFGLTKVFFGKNNAKSCFVSEMFTSPRF